MLKFTVIVIIPHSPQSGGNLPEFWRKFPRQDLWDGPQLLSKHLGFPAANGVEKDEDATSAMHQLAVRNHDCYN